MMRNYQFEPPRYTYSDYINWKEDWELVDGYPYQLNPMATTKYSALRTKLLVRCATSLEKNTNTDCEVYHRIDWKIDNLTVFRPDFMFVCNKVKLEYLDFPPSLIIEILTPINIKISRTIKFELYREQGVKYYLMVDVQKENIEVFELIDNYYKQVECCTFDLGKNCFVEFNFEEIWN